MGESGGISHRLAWDDIGWNTGLLDFWDDFSADGTLDERPPAAQIRYTRRLSGGTDSGPAQQRNRGHIPAGLAFSQPQDMDAG